MAHLYRLIGFLLLACCFHAHALVPKTTSWKITTPQWGWYYGMAKTDACNAVQAAHPGTAANVYTYSSTDAACILDTRRTSDGFREHLVWSYMPDQLICPANNSTPSGTSCACSSGFDEVNGACVPFCPYGRDPVTQACNACPTGEKQFTTITDTGSFQGCSKESACGTRSGKVIGTLQKEGGSQPSTSYACSGGCVAKVSYDFGLKYTDSKGVDHQAWVGDAIGTGQACATQNADGSTQQKPAPVDNPNNPDSPKTADCPMGQVKQTINGISACGVPSSGDTTTTSNTTSKTDAAGNTVTTVSTTTCVGTKCTTTSTDTTTPAGGGTSTTATTSKSQDKANFCQDNPGLSICKEGSFNGSCGAEPACTGDAIACAAASAAFKTACSLTPSASSEADLYDAEKGKTGDQTTGLPGNETKTISSANFVTTEQFAAVGLNDLSVTVHGTSINLPFSMLNQWLAYIGSIGVAASFLIAIRVALGGA